MPLPIGAAIGLGAGVGLIGTALGFSSSRATRNESRRQFNVQQNFAERQFEWQKEASSMSHKVDDMIKAGLHPTLAVGGGAGGAGGVVSSASPTARERPWEPSMQELTLGGQLALMESEIEKNRADANLTNTEAQLRVQEHGADLPGKMAAEIQAKIYWLKEQTSSSEAVTRMAEEIHEETMRLLKNDVEYVLERGMHSGQVGTRIGEIYALMDELEKGNFDLYELVGKPVIELLSKTTQSLLEELRNLADNSRNPIFRFILGRR